MPKIRSKKELAEKYLNEDDGSMCFSKVIAGRAIEITDIEVKGLHLRDLKNKINKRLIEIKKQVLKEIKDARIQ